ncbi:MAG: sigma 54-interacting transcriptional regulator [Planctomycetales bacterium]|nr:sigma 54-interacting transcriptional regulator [Planctomycetales bacterium]
MTPRPSRARPLHPVVAAFLEGDDRALGRLRPEDGTQPLLQTFARLREAWIRRDLQEEALEAAAATPLDSAHPDLALLFLSLWSIVASAAGRASEAAALVHRAETFLGTESPPALRVPILFAREEIARSRGDLAEQDRLREQAFHLLSPRSSRYRSLAIEHAGILAFRCEDAAVEEALGKVPRGSGGRLEGAADVVRFLLYVESGRVEEARRLRAREAGDAEVWEGLRGPVEDARALLDLMERRGAAAASERGGPLAWIEVPAHLLARRPAEALRAAREQARRDMESLLVGSEFPSFNLVRAELAAGNGEAARRVLEMRRGRGNVHWLDDLFLARVEWLADRREAARGHFARALAAAEHRSSEGRLAFELDLGCELRTGELVLISREAPRGRAGAARRREAGPAEPRDESPAADRPSAALGTGRLLGPSPALAAVRDLVLRFAPLDVPVLVTGETGTGKEMVARALHEAGPRADEPFLAVNCGAIAESLLETELFGHERGAFTGAVRAHRGLFEEAGAGVLLLDEVGDLTPRLQVSLLRVLETGEVRPVGSSRSRPVRCRIVAATNADLAALAAAGRYRQDLVFRLRRLEIAVPPLRERPEDILPLAEHFLAGGRGDSRRPSLAPELADLLRAHPWPGNVRELRNAVERMRLLNSEGPVYDLDSWRRGGLATAPAASAPAPPAPERAPSAPGAAPPLAAGDPAAEVLREGRGALRRRERLRDLFRRHGRLARGEVARILGVSSNTAAADLEALGTEGLVERVAPSGSTRSNYWTLRALAR